MRRDEFSTILGRESDMGLMQPDQKRPKAFRYLLFFIIGVCGGFFIVISFINTPPKYFPTDEIIHIPDGFTAPQIGSLLHDVGAIRSKTFFIAILKYKKNDKNIESGPYIFTEPLRANDLVERLTSGIHGIDTKKITLPEGITRTKMATLLSEKLPEFLPEYFIKHTDEGYLFPDTYFFLTTATSGTVITELQKNYLRRTNDLRKIADEKNLIWEDIMIMASLIEGEAITEKDRKMVSGILWKRIKQGMRLQVDAPFMYIMEKGSLELTESDLRSESPYNTYRHNGLPPTPINNPSLSSITAAIYPEENPYLFYLSDSDGKLYYATTFEEHKLNKSKYLR